MSAIPYDSLKYFTQLEAAGIPAEQARVIVETQKAALTEAVANQLATKGDLLEVKHELKADIASLEARLENRLVCVEGEMKLIKWMMGILLAGVMSLVLKAFF